MRAVWYALRAANADIGIHVVHSSYYRKGNKLVNTIFLVLGKHGKFESTREIIGQVLPRPALVDPESAAIFFHPSQGAASSMLLCCRQIVLAR